MHLSKQIEDDEKEEKQMGRELIFCLGGRICIILCFLKSNKKTNVTWDWIFNTTFI